MSKTISTSVISVDVETAESFLAKVVVPEAGVTGANRKASARIVQEYATEMLAGRWVLSHQGLAFNSRGTLVDGEHRMRAVILAAETDPDITVPFLVSFNVPDEATKAMDVGKRRLPSDFLTMEGEINTTSLAGVIRMGFCYDFVPYNGNESWTRYRLTPAMQSEYLEKNPQVREALVDGNSLRRLFKISAIGGFIFLADRDRPDVDVDEFLNGLRYGANLEKFDPALTLRDLMLNTRKGRGRFEAPEELALLIKAFNRWLAGDTYEILQFRGSEFYPRITKAAAIEERTRVG